MAITKRTVLREIVIRFDESGTFKEAFRAGERQALEDGVIVAERLLPTDYRTLVQIKSDVAGL